MLNGFVMLNTLKRNGKDVAPPIDELSLVINFEIDSPVVLISDGPLT